MIDKRNEKAVEEMRLTLCNVTKLIKTATLPDDQPGVMVAALQAKAQLETLANKPLPLHDTGLYKAIDGLRVQIWEIIRATDACGHDLGGVTCAGFRMLLALTQMRIRGQFPKAGDIKGTDRKVYAQRVKCGAKGDFIRLRGLNKRHVPRNTPRGEVWDAVYDPATIFIQSEKPFLPDGVALWCVDNEGDVEEGGFWIMGREMTIPTYGKYSDQDLASSIKQISKMVEAVIERCDHDDSVSAVDKITSIDGQAVACRYDALPFHWHMDGYFPGYEKGAGQYFKVEHGAYMFNDRLEENASQECDLHNFIFGECFPLLKARLRSLLNCLTSTRENKAALCAAQGFAYGFYDKGDDCSITTDGYGKES